MVSSAVPAGPCATYPGDDTWTPTPFAQGVVLIGDAAGYLDAITGEGLSLALAGALDLGAALPDALRAGAASGSFAAWERRERLRFGRYAAVTRLVLALARRPALRARILDQLGRRPALFSRLVAAAVGPTGTAP